MNTQHKIDVWQISRQRRHPLTFHTFDTLQPGEAFELISDHDPFLLHDQLSLHETRAIYLGLFAGVAGRVARSYRKVGPGCTDGQDLLAI